MSTPNQPEESGQRPEESAAQRDGLRQTLDGGADSGYRERLRQAFVQGDFSAFAGSRESEGGRRRAVAGGASGTESSLAGASSGGTAPPGTQNPPTSLAEQSSDQRTPSERRLAAILHPGAATADGRERARHALLSGRTAAETQSERALGEALREGSARPAFAAGLRSQFTQGEFGQQADSDSGAGSGSGGDEAQAPTGGRILRDARLTGARWAITALAAAAALILWIGPWAGGGEGWRVSDTGQLGSLATFNGRPFDSEVVPADGRCVFCPGSDAILNYRGQAHLGLDGATQAVLSEPQENEPLSMSFSSPGGEANFVAGDGSQPMRITTDQVIVLVSSGSTSVRYEGYGTCVVVVEGEAEVSLVDGVASLAGDSKRVWHLTEGQRLAVTPEGVVDFIENFTEKCELDPQLGERLQGMQTLRETLTEGQAL